MELNVGEETGDSDAANDILRFGIRKGGVGPKGEVGGGPVLRAVLDETFLNLSPCRLAAEGIEDAKL
jgi:hypothetical protein